VGGVAGRPREESMKINRKWVSTAAAAALVVTGLVAGAAPASADDYPYARKPCNFIYQGQCVQWATTTASCYRIMESNASATKKQACAIWRATGQVLVIH
jgi:hypothetical protein